MASSPIANGQQSSASALNGQFSAIQAQGAAILSLLTQIQLTTLVDYNRRLEDLSSKRARAARVKAADIAALFVVSDFGDIDQDQTTATLRVDTASATLRERNIPVSPLVSQTSFSASSGTVNALNADQTLLSVYSSTIPTGTFTLQLQQPVQLSVLTLELVAMASTPTVSVQVSSDGLVYTSASSVSINGDVLSCWFPSSEVKYIQVVLTPTHPDNLSGNSYTFGITNFSATTATYNLVSDVYFKPIAFTPQSASVIFHADSDDGLLYNLLLDGGQAGPSYLPVSDGTVLPLPGVTSTTVNNVTVTGGVFSAVLPADVYPKSIVVTDTTSGVGLQVVDGLSATDPNLTSLLNVYVARNGTTLSLVPAPSNDTHLYSISYLQGPSSMKATLLVHLSTTDRAHTPVFKGASLEEA